MRSHFNYWKEYLPINSGTFCFLLLFATILYLGCKEEQIAGPTDSAISTRGEGGGGLSTEDLIDLLGNTCMPDSIANTCDSVLLTATVVIQLPDYPGCTFTVEFEYYACRNWTDVVYFLADFKLLSYNCPAFTTAINNAYAAGEAALNAFIGNFDHAVATQFQLYVLNSQLPGTYDCDESDLIIYHYTRASCFKNCLITYPNGSVSNQKIACGSGCCIERIRACRDENGTWVIHTSNWSDYPYCDGPLLYDSNSLPIRCTTETACTLTCPGEN